jgi:hypothetical protein
LSCRYRKLSFWSSYLLSLCNWSFCQRHRLAILLSLSCSYFHRRSLWRRNFLFSLPDWHSIDRYCKGLLRCLPHR